MRNFVAAVARLAVAVFFSILFSSVLAASQETLVVSFYQGSGSGVLPRAGLISDAAGNLYGTAFYGGLYDEGMVYKLSPNGHAYTATLLHSFSVDGVDGFNPASALVMDSAGNLYGTTEFGGSGNCSVGFGCGTVFQLSPAADGSWTETILHDFQGTDGWQSFAELTMDSKGNLFGTTANGATYGQGTVYELSPASDGSWNFQTLYEFTGGNDGGVPWASVISDSKGRLYGVASEGGGSSSQCRYGCGTAFMLSPSSNGPWTVTVLHNFTTGPSDGAYPSNTLLPDGHGNLYGVASSGGGDAQAGVVFELSPANNGQWTETILHNFNQTTGDGLTPSSNLIRDASGRLYGTTLSGGSHGEGTVFKLVPGSDGNWSETVVYNFKQTNDGILPNGLMMARDGKLYGTTAAGGRYGAGTVFKIIP